MSILLEMVRDLALINADELTIIVESIGRSSLSSFIQSLLEIVRFGNERKE